MTETKTIQLYNYNGDDVELEIQFERTKDTLIPENNEIEDFQILTVDIKEGLDVIKDMVVEDD